MVNISPDPVTTATASLTEDFLVGGVVALIVTHPWVALALSMTLLALGLRRPALAVGPDQGAIRRFVSA